MGMKTYKFTAQREVRQYQKAPFEIMAPDYYTFETVQQMARDHACRAIDPAAWEDSGGPHFHLMATLGHGDGEPEAPPALPVPINIGRAARDE